MSNKKKHHFKLFIAGMNPGSFQAIENVREICENYLGDDYELEVIDIYQQRQLLKDMDIIAVPTLVRTEPKPEVRIIGDMLNKKDILKVLELKGGKQKHTS
ncbi:MAG: circadian clock KaiB family protein [Prolixibacteraceae bacterium]